MNHTDDKLARLAAIKKEARVQKLAKYILLGELERTGTSRVDLPGVIEGAFEYAIAFDDACERRTANMMKGLAP